MFGLGLVCVLQLLPCTVLLCRSEQINVTKILLRGINASKVTPRIAAAEIFHHSSQHLTYFYFQTREDDIRSPIH